MSDWLQRPLTEITRLLADRKLSPVELMEATLARIDATHEKVGAFVARRDRAALLADAKAAEARLARGEAPPLTGVPLGVKDLEDVAGLVTSHGSVPFADNLATRDSIQVERLRAAGAIVVGKTKARRAIRGISSARPGVRAAARRRRSPAAWSRWRRPATGAARCDCPRASPAASD
jgi:Asp-tRNA(Asn)/Glu-tRNA(Gln) amidotransferase A subunit family amidase